MTFMGKESIKTKEISLHRSWVLLSAAVFIAAYSLNCFVVSDVVTSLANNVIYADTPIPILVNYAHDFIELLAISFSYAAMICIICFSGEKKARAILAVFCIATAYKYAVGMIKSWIYAGSIPSSFVWDVVDVIYFTALEFLQLLVIYFISKGIICRYNDRLEIRKRLGGETSEVYPFKCIYDKENCLLRSAFVCAMATFTVKLGGAMLSDIWTIISYGLPTESVTWILMLVNYISMTVFGAIVYFAVYFFMSIMAKQQKHGSE